MIVSRSIKIVSVIALFLFFSGALTIGVSAYGDELTNDIASELADTSYGDFINDSERNGDTTINIAQKAMDIISASFSDGIKSFVGSFVIIASAVLVSALLGNMKSENSSLNLTYELVSTLALSVALYSVASSAISIASTALRSFSAFTVAYLPIMSSLYVSGGNAAAGAAATGGMTLLVAVIEAISDKLLLPMLKWCFAISLAGALPSGVNFSSIWTLIRNTVTTILSFIFFSLNFVLSFQPLIASSTDSFAMRTARFASGSFIPVIGSMLSETSKSVYASVGMIKSVSGSAAIVSVLAITIPPVIYILFSKLAVLFSAMLARMVGNDNQSRFLYEINSLLGIVLGLIIGAAAVFIIGAGVFINTTAGAAA